MLLRSALDLIETACQLLEHDALDVVEEETRARPATTPQVAHPAKDDGHEHRDDTVKKCSGDPILS